jgi:DNA (cytosine-5)-methyltransferase 1
MKQSSLLSFLTEKGLAPGTDVVDLFCGMGGFSCGAKRAGHRVVLAVDNNETLLKCHQDNHPECRHLCLELPTMLPLPTSGKWHLHGSPPCTKLSIMKPKPKQEHEQVVHALDVVTWFLDLATACNASSWSMEQVCHKSVIEQLEDRKSRHPLKFDWVSIDAVDYEVPQHRRRVIAGPPFLIANLRFFQSKKRKLCVRDVFPNPPKEYLRNALYSRPDPETGENVEVPLKDKVRSIDRPSFTILAAGHIKWSDADGTVLRHLVGAERAIIQTFPADYVLPKSKMDAKMAVGNAVPPRLAEILMTPTVSG